MAPRRRIGATCRTSADKTDAMNVSSLFLLLSTLFCLLCDPVSAQTLRFTWEGVLGREGEESGAFSHPSSIAADPAGNLYIADTGNHRIRSFDRDGQIVAETSGFGLQTRQFTNPMAVAATGLDVYAADTQNRRVIRMDRKLNLLGMVMGDDPENRFGCIRGIAVSTEGDIYLSDTENEEIVRLGASRQVEARFGGLGDGEGRLSRPSGVAVDRDGNVFVADTGHHRIAVFDAFGGYVGELGKETLKAPEGVAVDEAGWVYVADTGNHRIVALSRDGLILVAFGAEGKGPGTFRAPNDIAVLPDGRVFVADTGNHRICRLVVQ